jgi:hypothetical protein
LIDAIRWKRSVIVLAVTNLAAGLPVAVAAWPSFGMVVSCNTLMAVVGDVFVPAVGAITLGLVSGGLFTSRMGRNCAFDHAGNVAIAHRWSRRAPNLRAQRPAQLSTALGPFCVCDVVSFRQCADVAASRPEAGVRQCRARDRIDVRLRDRSATRHAADGQSPTSCTARAGIISHAVPANRIGHLVYATAQLKTMQEVITLVVFAVFSVLYLKEPFTWNYIIGFALIAAGAYFVFRGPLGW